MGITTHIKAGCLFILACICGCSAGGFQGSDNPPDQNAIANAALKRVHGTASKGIIRNGNVSIFALNSNGSKGPLLKKASTNAFGKYSSSVTLSGPTLVSASGAYTDESTGLEAVIPEDAPLRAAIDTVSSVMTIAITPLTELAVRKADTPPLRLVGGNIAAANKLISDIFKVDIINTPPLDPTLETFSDVATSLEQKDYTLVLAALSQMAKDSYGGSLNDTIAAMNTELAKGDSIGAVIGAQFQAALTNFLKSDKNKTGVTDISKTNLTNAGGSTKIIKLATSGTLQAGKAVYGITVKIALPPGVTVRISDLVYHEADSRAVYASGVFSSAPNLGIRNSIGQFVPASGTEAAYLNITAFGATSGSSLGEFLTVVCDMPIGSNFSASDFKVPAFKAVDGDGNELQGVTIMIQ